MKTKENDSQVTVVGSHAAMLSIAEVGLGSLLHSLHIPFTGFFLSLNQILLLSRASSMAGKNGSRFMPGSISFVAAALKSLSPAGKKLTPMLGISIQGLMYNVGIFLFGHSTPGRILGAILSSIWGFCQPFLIYYFIFGKMLVQILKEIDEYPKTLFSYEFPSVWYFVGAVITVKIILSIAIAISAPRLSSQTMTNYFSRLTSFSVKRKPTTYVPQGPGRYKKIAWLAAKDMCVWPFIACVLLGSVSFWFVEGGISTLVVMNTLRPIAIGFLLFFCMRVLPMEKVAEWLERQNRGIGQAFRIALFKVKQM